MMRCMVQMVLHGHRRWAASALAHTPTLHNHTIKFLQCVVSHATHLPLLRRDEESLCVAAVIGCCCSATVGRRAACAWHGCVTLSAA